MPNNPAHRPRIYLDNAATSWPKPESVYVAVDRTQRELGAAFGRGTYQQAIAVSRLVDQTRDLIATHIQAPHRRNIAFTYSCTDSLCTAIFGLLQSGDHVVTSVIEHNSVLRPLLRLEQEQNVSVTRVGCNLAGQMDPVAVLAAIQPRTRLVVLSQSSNVTGAIQELSSIGRHCRQLGIPFLIDAAQSIGHLPIDVGALSCDLLAAAGHKGLLGPLGTGFLYYSDRLGETLRPLRVGGTGSMNTRDEQPNVWPEKFEAGNLNLPGIAGLQAGLNYLNSPEGHERSAQDTERNQQLLTGLQQIAGLSLQGPRLIDQRLGVFSISLSNINCHDAAAILDTNWSIQTRAGFHCAPWLHRSIGTESAGGTLRISPGLFTTAAEVDTTLAALQQLVG